jgi:hypothetical protein
VDDFLGADEARKIIHETMVSLANSEGLRVTKG